MIDLDLLRAFAAIYRAGSLTKATRAVGLSQAALSIRLQSLEAHIGEPLFVRHRQGVRPSVAGSHLARRVLPLLHDLESAFAEATDRTSPQGFRLGGPLPFCSKVLIPNIQPFPGLEFSFGLTEPLLGQLTAGTLDGVIATHRMRIPGVQFEPIYQEEFALVASPEWRRDRTDAEALQHLLAFSEQMPMIRRYLDGTFLPSGPPRLLAPDLFALLAAAEAGWGTTVLPTYFCAASLQEGRLEELSLRPRRPENTLFLALPKGQKTPTFLNYFVVERELGAAAPDVS